MEATIVFEENAIPLIKTFLWLVLTGFIIVSIATLYRGFNDLMVDIATKTLDIFNIGMFLLALMCAVGVVIIVMSLLPVLL